jgi:hypothetical protein
MEMLSGSDARPHVTIGSALANSAASALFPLTLLLVMVNPTAGSKR